MANKRTQIEQALEQMNRRQHALDFQYIAFHLVKNRWPDFGANEWYSDGGEDGITIPSSGSDGIKRSLACSLTGTLTKVKKDCRRIADRKEKINVLIFVTSIKVDRLIIDDWREEIRTEFNHDLIVFSKAYIVAELERPENLWLCKDYLDLNFTDESDIKILKRKIRKAALQNIENWKNAYGYNDSYQIELTLKLELKSEDKQYEYISFSNIFDLLRRTRQLILKGEPGAGKTISLLQIASYLLSKDTKFIPIFISLSEWSVKACDLFSLIANDLVFKENNVSISELEILNKAGELTFFLNGWNEIPHESKQQLNQLLKNVVRNSPSSSFIIATREIEFIPPVINPDIVYVEFLNANQRREIIMKYDIKKADNLITQIENKPDLDKITRTPLFLSSIIEIFKKNNIIPNSRYEILNEFINSSEIEHKVSLETSVTEGFHGDYLSWLAASFVRDGKTSSNNNEAQNIIADCSDLLLKSSKIGKIPNAKNLLSDLVQYHILVRSHDKNSVRFLHQQFQEWYAANHLYEQVTSIHDKKFDEDLIQFQKEFLNQPVWQESLLFLAERLALDGKDAEELASDLIRWTMPVDLILAAKLVRLASNNIWLNVKQELSLILRKWYDNTDKYHKKCALSAMFATASSDYSDIIMPLIENEDDQVRLETYRLWEPFTLLSIDFDWHARILSWPQDRILELIHEIGWNAGLSHLKLIAEFAESDNNISIRVAALQMLALNGAFEILGKNLIDIDWSVENYFDLLDWLPDNILLKVSPQIKAKITKLKNQKTRLKILLKLSESKNKDIIKLLKEEIEKNSIESKILVGSCLPRIASSSEKWVQKWIGDKLAKGQLWEDLYVEKNSSDFVEEQLNIVFKSADSELLTKLSEQVFDKNIEIDMFRKRITIFSKINPDIAAEFILKEYLNINKEIRENSSDDKKRNRKDIIYLGMRELPFCSKANAVLNYTNLYPVYENVINVLQFLVIDTTNFDNSIVNLTSRAKNQLKKKVFEWEELNLTSQFDHGQLKAHLAEILGIIGNLKDIKIIAHWIKDDQKRDEKEYEEWKIRRENWEKNKEWPPPAQYVKYARSHQYVEAITQIKSSESVNLLKKLLFDSEYIGQAAYSLVKIATSNQDDHLNIPFFKPDYKNILLKRKREIVKVSTEKFQKL